MPDPLIIPLGFLIGILVSAPVGPVNIICINRSLRLGFLAGLTAGLGAAIADGLLASLAGFGITTVAELVDQNDSLIQVAGGAVLVLFGLGVLIARPPDEKRQADQAAGGALRALGATFLITITNPGSVLGMFALFGGVVGEEPVPEGDYAAAALLVLSVIAGALMWWIGLSAITSALRHRMSRGTYRMINLVSGAILMAIGVIVLVRALFAD